MITPTNEQYAKFGSWCAGIMDGFVAEGDPNKANLAIEGILTGAEAFGIAINAFSSDGDAEQG